MGLPRFFSRLRVEQLEDKVVPATVFALTNPNGFITFDSAAPTVITGIKLITGLSTNEEIVGIDFRPRTGQLFGVGVVDNGSTDLVQIYRIDPQSGAATAVGTPSTLPSGDGFYGVDFNPTVDRLRVVNAAGANARFNPNTGARADAPTNDTALTFAAPTLGPIVDAAYDRNFDRQTIATPANNAIPTTLYAIDRSTSRLVKIGGLNGTPSPNGGVVTDVGPLGITLNSTSDAGLDIIPGAGLGKAFAALTTVGGSTTNLYSIDLATGAATSIGFIGPGPGAVVLRDIAVQPDDLNAVGYESGTTPTVIAYDSRTGVEKFNFQPYASGFTGGVRVATGDVNGDGVPDIITAAGFSGGPHVKAFDGITGTEIRSFFAFDEAFSGGLFVASGDVNSDGYDDIIVGAGSGSSLVRVFNGRDLSQLFGITPYGTFTGGARVAAGDFDLDGKSEIVTGAGTTGGPHVRTFDSTGAEFVSTALPSFASSFFAYDQGFSGGVYLSVGDVDGDGRPDIITAAGAGGGPHVKAFSGLNSSLVKEFFAYDPSYSGGVTVTNADTNNDGRNDFVVGTNGKLGATARRTVFSGRDLSLISETNIVANGIYVG
jgi:Domain of unknown function (DUF4394)/FG-GAP-like repeat/FG-GAP repeat